MLGPSLWMSASTRGAWISFLVDGSIILLFMNYPFRVCLVISMLMMVMMGMTMITAGSPHLSNTNRLELLLYWTFIQSIVTQLRWASIMTLGLSYMTMTVAMTLVSGLTMWSISILLIGWSPVWHSCIILMMVLCVMLLVERILIRMLIVAFSVHRHDVFFIDVIWCFSIHYFYILYA